MLLAQSLKSSAICPAITNQTILAILTIDSRPLTLIKMSFTNLLWFLVPVLALQILMFFVIRQRKKKWRKDDVLEKYGISTRGDLFRMLQNPHLTDEDRNKLQNIYEKGVLD